jgi:RNA ligase
MSENVIQFNEFLAFHKMARYSREVVVTEKLDGTSSQISIGENGEFFTGSRKRWITPSDDNYGFSRWANENKDELLKLGPGRHFGEWWGSGIQRGYGLNNGEKRFSLFNVARWNELTKPSCCSVVPVLWRGQFDDMNVQGIMSNLLRSGSVAEPGFMRPEGIVIFHTAGCFGLKKTFEKDESGKG